MSLRVKKEFKQELASTHAEKNESTEFLNLTNVVLQRCEEMINILESYSARVKQDVRNIEQKAKTIVTNFQCKLEGYIKCENMALMQRDQAQFISHNQGSLKSMADHIKSMIDSFCIFRDSYKSTLNLRQNTKGGLEIIALKRSAAEKQHN
ncbi:hypothetical protein FGO68_gene884 [Halteria grandinella]|uniref:Uncharacterized protein n=1 Tax=Halteria grandinella TaxID=5974 RepID=A0A8J8NC23_HALGN|nr:hypothetical protein FGO68_gene884 [Halteria grandinella]